MERKRVKMKIDRTNMIRRAIQIASFILMPGLFISTFLSIKSVYTALISGAFDVAAQLPQLLILLAVIPITVIMGRFFCGFLCSFGAIGDFLWFISKKVRKKKLKVNAKADKIMKMFKYALLIFIVVFVWTLGVVTIAPDINPWNIFGMYTKLSAWQSLAGLWTVGGLLLLLIFVGSFLVERFFCRYMCPLGAVFAITSKLRIFKIKKPSEVCKSCKVCTTNCSMGIDMYKHDVIKSGECIDCMQCIAPCPKQNAQVSFAGKEAAPLVAAVVVSVAMTGMYFAGKQALQSAYAAPAQPTIEISQTAQPGAYTDGTYTGSAKGYRGKTYVEVIVENGYITNIDVLSTDDDDEFFLSIKAPIINGILDAQSSEVDTVSGATYSCDAIINAVSDALSDLKDSSGNCLFDSKKMGDSIKHLVTISPMSTQTPEPSATTLLEEIPEFAGNSALEALEDGVYTGSGSGFHGQITVDVTMNGGEITAVEIVSSPDDAPYVNASLSVTDDIIALQDVEVDTVSGATYTSNAIIEAVADALGLEFTNTNGTQGGGQGRGGGGH